MAKDASKVRAGSGGGIVSHAPLGTAVPTDTTTALNVAFVDVGYISDDGITHAIAQSTSDIRAFGGDLVRRITSEFGFSFNCTMIEHNANSVAAFYGNGSATAWEVKNSTIRKAWVLEVVDGAKIRRTVVPDGEVTERGDVAFSTEEAVGYEVTVTAYPNATGVFAFEYATA